MKKTLRTIAWALTFALPVITFSACSDDDDPPAPDPKSDKAEIVSVTFKDQPVIQGTPTRNAETTPESYVFYVRHDVAASDINALVPTIEISEGATISPKSDDPADFSTESGTVRYTVTAEDGVTKKEYDLICEKLADDDAWVISVVIEDAEGEDGIVAEQPAAFEAGATSATFTLKAGADKTNITPIITYKGASITPESGEPQDFTDGSVEYTVTAIDGTTTFIFTLNCEQELFEGAVIEEISIDSEFITIDINRSGNEIYFAVNEETTDEQIATLSLDKFVISDGATAKIGTGENAVIVTQGYSPGFVLGEPILITVEAENGDINKYEITCYKTKYYDFDDWYEKEETVTIVFSSRTYRDVPAIDPWCNANVGICSAKLAGNYTGGYATVGTETTPSGSGKAVQMNTLRINPSGALSYFVPNVVAGSCFLGGFETNQSRVLNSTKFGVPFYEQPIYVRGMFQYTPGTDFWEDKNQVEGREDSFAMTAVLFEIENEGGMVKGDWGDYLDGYDMKDIQNVESVVAYATWTSSETYSDFTPFELKLDYWKEYDSSKKYKFAIIFSSSKDGAEYHGAIGSTLIVDDVYVILK